MMNLSSGYRIAETMIERWDDDYPSIAAGIAYDATLERSEHSNETLIIKIDQIYFAAVIEDRLPPKTVALPKYSLEQTNISPPSSEDILIPRNQLLFHRLLQW